MNEDKTIIYAAIGSGAASFAVCAMGYFMNLSTDGPLVAVFTGMVSGVVGFLLGTYKGSQQSSKAK